MKSSIVSKQMLPGVSAMILLTIVLMALIAPYHVLANSPTEYNQGDPFTNGDLIWDEHYQTYMLADYGVWVKEELAENCPPPFEYPRFLQSAHALGTGHFVGWGVSDFTYSFDSVKNDRQIIFENELPGRGHCAQGDYDTSTTNWHYAHLLLDPDHSGWDDEGVYYHASFLLFVDNEQDSETGTHVDQATMGISRVDAYWIAMGHLDLTKVSANDDITNGNPNYSLKDAVYSITRSSDGAEMGCLSTDENGYAISPELPVDTYDIKEVSAPLGYEIDEQVYTVQIRPNETVHVGGGSVSDIPKKRPVDTVVEKKDSSLLDGPQGEGLLSGGQFTISFYTDMQGDISDTPERTWVFETDEQGKMIFDLDHFVQGDAFYYDTGYDGLTDQPVLPRGRVTIQETKAPTGYVADDGEGGPAPIHIAIIDGDSMVPLVSDGVQVDSVARGDYAITKIGSVGFDQDDPQSVDPVSIPGVQFQIFNTSSHPVVSPEDGTTIVDPGGLVATITTDQHGWASTRHPADVNGWQTPKTWAGALAYGEYRIHEVIPVTVQRQYFETYGTELLTVDDWAIRISKNMQYDPARLVNDKIPQTPLRIVKTDAESNKPIQEPCSFRILDSSKEIVSFTSHYPEEHTMDTWTTNETGEVVLPMLLKQGMYYLQEVAAPDGYVLARDLIPFVVSKDHNSWSDPLTITFKDTPVKGSIQVVKKDIDTDEDLSGACYAVAAAEDITTPDGVIHAKKGDVVAELTTNESGTASTDPLYLGSYDIYETRPPSGYVANNRTQRISLESDGGDTPVVTFTYIDKDKPTTFLLSKQDAVTGQPLSDASFDVWMDDDDVKTGYRTDDSGCFKITHLKPGHYHVEEQIPPQGYWISEGGQDLGFTVDDRGFISLDGSGGVLSDTVNMVVRNEPVSISTSASIYGEHTAVPTPDTEIWDAVEYHGCVPGEEYMLQATLHRVDVDGPILDEQGSPIVATTTFIAPNTEGSVNVRFDIDATMMADTDVVVFESLYHGEDLIAEHSDISDKDQTVTFLKEEVLEDQDIVQRIKTGDTHHTVAVLCCIASIIVICFAGYMIHRPRQLLRRRSLGGL